MSDPTADKLTYSIANLAAAMDLSVDSIQKAIRKGDLSPKYFGSKPIIPRAEAIRWIESLSDEKAGA